MADAKETKEQVFRRLAEARTRKALKAIRLIENLAAYPHTHEHTEKITTVLRNAVDSVEYRMGGEKKSERAGFSLEGDDE